MRAGRWMALGLVCLFVGCGDTHSEAPAPPIPPADVFQDVLPGVVFTRGPGGMVVPGAVYDEPGDVLLFGAGLQDGVYAWVVVDDDCEQNLSGGLRAGNRVSVIGGKLGPVVLAPFDILNPRNPQTQPGELYRVYVAPVNVLSDPSRNCFGFAPLASLSTVFSLRVTEPTLRR